MISYFPQNHKNLNNLNIFKKYASQLQRKNMNTKLKNLNIHENNKLNSNNQSNCQGNDNETESHNSPNNTHYSNVSTNNNERNEKEIGQTHYSQGIEDYGIFIKSS